MIPILKYILVYNVLLPLMKSKCVSSVNFGNKMYDSLYYNLIILLPENPIFIFARWTRYYHHSKEHFYLFIFCFCHIIQCSTFQLQWRSTEARSSENWWCEGFKEKEPPWKQLQPNATLPEAASERDPPVRADLVWDEERLQSFEATYQEKRNATHWGANRTRNSFIKRWG